MAKKKTKLDKMSKKEKTSLAYALATNLAKYGKPQTPKNERKLTKGELKKREKHMGKFKKAFSLEEVKEILHTIMAARPKDKTKPKSSNGDKLPSNYNPRTGKFTEQKLKNPKKADLNKDGKLSSYEKKRGAAIEKAIQKESHTGNPNDKYVVRPCKNKKEPWAVWEGEVRVKGFATKEEAQKFADKKNKEQGLNEKDDKNKPHKVLSPKELDRLAALPPTDPSFKKDRRHKKLMKKKNAKV
jgi:hypothetical protein